MGWDKASVLGSGAFSTVYKAFMRADVMQLEFPAVDSEENGSEASTRAVGSGAGAGGDSLIPVAVKKLTKAAFSEDGFLDEIKILSKVPACRHITNLHAVIFAESTCLIVSELGGPHTLAWHLASAGPPPADEQDSVKALLRDTTRNASPLASNWISRIKVCIGIADALKVLQSMNPAVLHLDLKSSNVLISDLGNGRFLPKLCDFGLAVELKPGFEFLSPANHGTLQWMAPEVMKDEDVELSKGFDTSADVFSFAILMWEVAHPGRVPWDELAVDTTLTTIQDRIREFVCSGRRLKSHDAKSWPPGYERLMRMCWRQNPADRPCFVRSFLTDPDSFTFASSSSRKSGEAAQETIGTSLKRVLWDAKSAKRVSMGAAVTRQGSRLRTDQGSSRQVRGSSEEQPPLPTVPAATSMPLATRPGARFVDSPRNAGGARAPSDSLQSELSSVSAHGSPSAAGASNCAPVIGASTPPDAGLPGFIVDDAAAAVRLEAPPVQQLPPPPLRASAGVSTGAGAGAGHAAQARTKAMHPARRSPTKLRRQSSVLGHGCVNPHLEASLDYHDHDGDATFPVAESSYEFLEAEDKSDEEKSLVGTPQKPARPPARRHISASLDENSLSRPSRATSTS
jgi:serine/threonine protein kinase